MRTFTLFISLPSLVTLIALAVVDRGIGTRRLWRAVVLGTVSGLLAALAYDVFRLPFVFADLLGVQRIVPLLHLFKVFPQFGAMVLGQPLRQEHYSLTTEVVGWAYHFSNGLTFGIMYVALVGIATRRHWAWGILFAVGLEIAMLLTPYPSFFHIPITTAFIIVTLSAHLIFGAVMGFVVSRKLATTSSA